MIRKIYILALLCGAVTIATDQQRYFTESGSEIKDKRMVAAINDRLNAGTLLKCNELPIVLAHHGIKIIKTAYRDHQAQETILIEQERKLRNPYKDTKSRYFLDKSTPKQPAQVHQIPKLEKKQSKNPYAHVASRYMQIPQRYKAKNSKKV